MTPLSKTSVSLSLGGGVAATIGLFCLLWASGMGCEMSAKEKMREANAALLGGDAERAQVVLEEALTKDATLAHAPLLRGRIFMAKRQFEKAEQEFLQVWESNTLGQTEGLDAEQKRQKRILADELWPELYLGWAGTLDGRQNPQKYEETLKKGLQYEPKNPRMNMLLVDFYTQQAERLVEQGKRAEAAAMLGEIDRLRTTRARRQGAQARARKLDQELFLDAAGQRFAADVLPGLEQAQLWDADQKAAVVVAEMTLDRRLKEEQWQARGRAGLRVEVERLIRRVGGFDQAVVIPPGAWPQGFKILEESFNRGKYQAKGLVPIQEVTLLTLHIKELHDVHSVQQAGTAGAASQAAPSPP